MNHTQIQNLVEAYALGILELPEKVIFENHLENCSSCQIALMESQEALGFLALNADPVTPSPHLKSRVLTVTSQPSRFFNKEKIKNKILLFHMKWILFSQIFNKLKTWTRRFSTKTSQEDLAHVYIREEDGHWERVSSGVEVKILFADFEQGVSTLLMRMEAGSRIPRHYHHGIEQIYLLEGDACSGEVPLKANDYFRAEATSIHLEVTTKNGCLMLMIVPDIEFLPNPPESFAETHPS